MCNVGVGGFGLKIVEKGEKGRIKNPDPHLTVQRWSRLRINILLLSGSTGCFCGILQSTVESPPIPLEG